ncbi:hypothetical protein HPB47_018795, partial [Ixodes persulcatus]
RRSKSTRRSGTSAHGVYCMELVRKHDHENYLCSLLLPDDGRRTAFAVRALNVELAQIRDVVSRPDIGLMRLQFWTDALERIYKGSAPEQPVAQELAAVIRLRKLSKHWLSRLIESRRESDKAHTSLEEAEEYAERSVSPVLYLTLQSMGVQDLNCDHVASHVGKLQGLTNLIRGVPVNCFERPRLRPPATSGQAQSFSRIACQGESGHEGSDIRAGLCCASTPGKGTQPEGKCSSKCEASVPSC